MLLTGCKSANEEQRSDSDEKSIFSRSFQDFPEIDFLNDYQKVSDTSIYGESYIPQYKITRFKKENHTLILFRRITLDNKRKEHYTIVDTIQLALLPSNQHLTIGYCEKEGINNEGLIAVIEVTENLTTENIQRAWRANIDTEKIESLDDVQGFKCWNEFYDSE